MESEKHWKRDELEEKQQFFSRLIARELKACVVMMPGESPVKAKKTILQSNLNVRQDASCAAALVERSV